MKQVTVRCARPFVENPREQALEALAEMKRLEAERSKEMKAIRVDSRTVVCGTRTSARMQGAENGEQELRSGGNNQVNTEMLDERKRLFAEIFKGAETLTTREMKVMIGGNHGISEKRFNGLLTYARIKKIIIRVPSVYPARYRLAE